MKAGSNKRTLQPQGDMELSATIEAASAGDRAAFAALINSHYELIYRIAFKHVRKHDQAEDIAQETCVKLARKLPSFNFDAQFTTWLYRLTVNTAIDWQRKAHRKHERNWPKDFDRPTAAPSPERQTATKELIGLVESLPRKLRDAVLLVFRDGLSHGQAAAQLGCAESTVSWRIHEARKALSEMSAPNSRKEPNRA